MTTFKIFLAEQGRTSEIGYDEAIKFIRQHCPQYAHNLNKNSQAIYRGVPADFTYGYVDPRHDERLSANTTNEYTLLLSNLPNWKHFPKRSYSLVCSSSINVARGFGTAYVVFAPDGTSVGVAPEGDLWMSFGHLGQKADILQLDELNDVLDYMINTLLEEPVQQDNWNDFKQQLQHLSQTLQQYSIDSIKNKSPRLYRMSRDLLQYFEQYNNDVIMALSDLLDPQNNGFSVQQVGNLDLHTNREVWLSNQAVFVRADRIKEILNDL